MKKLIFSILLLTSLLAPLPTLGQETNITGLHLSQTSDVEKAIPYIKGKEDSWGWVTIVINKRQLDQHQWQDFFNNCRQNHIIPILRLATQAVGESWERPSLQDLHDFANFLEKLNWPSNPKHLILFNEPNHANEWGGEADPHSYAQTVREAIPIFKEKDPSFHLLLAGVDLSAPQQAPQHYSAQKFYQELAAEYPNIFNDIDGLASHSYPNPDYLGTPQDQGPQSIQAYDWEINLFKTLGLNKNLDLYITETGWPHLEGEQKNYSYYKVSTAANFLVEAFEIWSKNKQIKAVTPFIFNYPQEPFDHFSWLNIHKQAYPEYETIKSLPHPSWHPYQENTWQMESSHLPLLIFPKHEHNAKLRLKNTGQSIWGEYQEFCLLTQSSQEITAQEKVCLPRNIKILPQEEYEFTFTFTVNSAPSNNKKLFISLEKTEPLHIKPLLPNTKLPYRPETNLLTKLKNLLSKL